MKKLDVYNVWDLVWINNYILRYEDANNELLVWEFNIDFLLNVADKVDKWFFVKGFWLITWMIIDWWKTKYIVNNEPYTYEWLFILDWVDDGINILNYINYSNR